mmetsp:Transcript_25972/g.55849  ORF Transcript_25972/g.55849 Transcript_25972/m.55849 type:complete len:100 (-) Transcript_25972:1018-1317(-)
MTKMQTDAIFAGNNNTPTPRPTPLNNYPVAIPPWRHPPAVNDPAYTSPFSQLFWLSPSFVPRRPMRLTTETTTSTGKMDQRHGKNLATTTTRACAVYAF